jgi:GNAT superfamily N-acetyltransferase
MEIVRGSAQYYDDVAELVKQFHEEALNEYGFKLDRTALLKTMEDLRDEAFLLIIDGKCQGLIAGKGTKTPTGVDNIWHEVVWFINEKHRKHGLHLLDKALDTLKSEGYTQIVMVLMENSKAAKLSKLYERLGFLPLERHFIKKL